MKKVLNSAKKRGNLPKKKLSLSASLSEHELLNLLARIHRDGGHHTAEVGLLQSIRDAELLVVSDRDEIRVLQKTIKHLEDQKDIEAAIKASKEPGSVSLETLTKELDKKHKTDVFSRTLINRN